MDSVDFERGVAEGLASDAQIAAYSIAQYALLAASALSLCLSLLVILRASPRTMSTYKWHLLNQVGWNFALDFFLCLTQPVSIPAVFCGFSASALFRHRSSAWNRSLLTIITACEVGKTSALYTSLFYRMTASLGETSAVYRVYRRTSPYLETALLLVLEAGVVLAHQTDAKAEADRRVFEAKSPAIRALYQREPSFTCAVADEREQAALNIAGLLVGAVGFGCTISAFAFAVYTLQKRKDTFHAKTYQMQVMLLKSCAAQVFASVVTMTIPFLLLAAIIHFRLVQLSYLLLFATCLVSTHTTIDFLIMIVVIRPYNEYLLRLFRQDRIVKLAPKRLFSTSVRTTTLVRSSTNAT
ncbi:hypothetical protein M3Y99_00743200 [Aphelenchoides fujianensis]|nr:hypothetical protein M3Y99_00743200 [Aphelenchoides fujianensis]